MGKSDKNRTTDKHRFLILDVPSGDILMWTMDEVLEEINRDRSDAWQDYDETDWFEGWMEWVDHHYRGRKDEAYPYALIGMVEYYGNGAEATMRSIEQIREASNNTKPLTARALTTALPLLKSLTHSRQTSSNRE